MKITKKQKEKLSNILGNVKTGYKKTSKFLETNVPKVHRYTGVVASGAVSAFRPVKMEMEVEMERPRQRVAKRIFYPQRIKPRNTANFSNLSIRY